MKRLVVLLVLFALSVPVKSQAVPGFIEARMGTMTGQVMFEGKPLAKVMLAFFDVSKGLPPVAGQGGRSPDMRTYSDKDGKFSLKLLAGSYYLGVLLRGPEEKLGPPREGEAYYFADGGEGKLRRFALEKNATVDHGLIECAVPGAFRETEDTFTVTGRVVEGAGEDTPVKGAIVLAKTKTSQYRPEYVSKETGANGAFTLFLPPGKKYNLMARTAITGDKPKPGDAIGKYGAANALEPQAVGMSELTPPPGITSGKPERVDAEESIPITGESGQVVSGLVIHMYKMPDQKAIQEEKKNTAGAPDYEQGAALKNLLFATNSAQLQGNFAEELDLWVKFLQSRRDLAIELNGYTDDVGSEQYNQHLSERRAQTVGSYLIDKGVAPERLVAVGYGEKNPIADNATPEGRSRNRRVEIKFLQ